MFVLIVRFLFSAKQEQQHRITHNEEPIHVGFLNMSITCGFWRLRSFKAPGRQKLVASAGGAAGLRPFAEQVTVHG